MHTLNYITYTETAKWNGIDPDHTCVISSQGLNSVFNELSAHIRCLDRYIQEFVPNKYEYIFSMHQDFYVSSNVETLESAARLLFQDIPQGESNYLFGDLHDPLNRISFACRYDTASILELKNYFHSILRSVLMKQPLRHTIQLYTVGHWKQYGVSVLIPLYNGVEFLLESLGSIEKQTYPFWEVIIGVNGHSEESDVFKTAKKYERESDDGYRRIRVIHYSTKGKENTMNAMVQDMAFDIISLLDVDDYWEPTKLFEQIQLWKFGKYDIIGTHCKYFGDLNHVPTLPEKEIQRSSIIRSNPMVNSSMMIHKRDGHWTGLYRLDDYDMWLRLAYNGRRFYNIPQVLTHHRIHKQSAFNNTNSEGVPKLQKHWNQRYTDNLVTLVTCYYAIKSKFPSTHYMEWMSNFLSLNCNMVIYTDKESESMIRSFRARNGLMHRTSIIIKPIDDWEMAKYRDDYLHSHLIDTEKKIHSPELYMLWNEKTYFVMDAIKANPFQSQWFFWVDIGCIRDKHMLRYVNTFPNPYKIMDMPSDKFILSSIVPFQAGDNYREPSSPIPMLFLNRGPTMSCGNIVRIQGGFFGGHVSQWSKWCILFSDMFHEFIRTRTFIGKDQYIMSSVYLNHTDRIHIMQASDKNRINDPWFDFLFRLN
jgi:glycosyltransferase involved in cell wall biosynthesis